MKKGIDISSNNGSVDFNEVLSNGDITFILIRSSYGVYQDYTFGGNRDEARKYGFQVGFYHYAYPQYNTPEMEAEAFYKAVGDLRPGELLALDFEESYVGDPVDWCKRFLAYIERNLNYKPLLYMNLSMLNSHDWSQVNCGGWWIANYDGNMEYSSWWNIKQYSEKGSIKGVTGAVDLDSAQFPLNLLAYKPTLVSVPQPIAENQAVVPLEPSKPEEAKPSTAEVVLEPSSPAKPTFIQQLINLLINLFKK